MKIGEVVRLKSDRGPTLIVSSVNGSNVQICYWHELSGEFRFEILAEDCLKKVEDK